MEGRYSSDLIFSLEKMVTFFEGTFLRGSGIFQKRTTRVVFRAKGKTTRSGAFFGKKGPKMGSFLPKIWTFRRSHFLTLIFSESECALLGHI